MSPEKPFDPRKGKEITSEGEVQNIDFRDPYNQAQIINALNRLRTDLKGAGIREVRDCFQHMSSDSLRNISGDLRKLSVLLGKLADEKDRTQE